MPSRKRKSNTRKSNTRKSNTRKSNKNNKPVNINKLIKELKKLNKQTNILRSNINRNSRKLSNIITNLNLNYKTN